MKHVIIYIWNHLNFAFIKKMACSVYILSNYCIRTYSKIHHPNCGTISVATTVLVKWLHSQLWIFSLKQLSKLLTQLWLDSWNLLAELLGKYDIHSTHIYMPSFLSSWLFEIIDLPIIHSNIKPSPTPFSPANTNAMGLPLLMLNNLKAYIFSHSVFSNTNRDKSD